MAVVTKAALDIAFANGAQPDFTGAFEDIIDTLTEIVGAATGATQLPAGTTGERPTPVLGMMRFNSTSAKLETYEAGAWTNVIGSGSGDVTAASSFGTDNRLIASDGTGKGVQSTSVDVTLGVVSGVTQLNVDNLRLDGNAIISTDSAGDLVLTPDTTGDLILDGTKWPQDLGTNLYLLQTDGAGQASWVVATGTGDVVGPASATDNAIVRFDSTTGKLVQDGAVTIADSSGNMAGVGTINTLALPASDFSGVSDSETLTNKSIDADDNTITNIGLAEFDTDTGDTLRLFDASVLDSNTVVVTSNGTTITLAVEKVGGGDVRVFFSTGVHVWNTTPADTVTLTPGTDTVPVINYVFFLESTKALTANTTGFPTAEHSPIATVLCQSAASLQTDGAFKLHAWMDHVTDTSNNGHLSHLNAWVRAQNATWFSGVALTSPGIGAGVFDIVTAVGVVRQLHDHTMPALTTVASVDPLWIKNDNATAFKRVADLTTEVTDSEGVSMSGKHYNLVVWGVASENTSDCKVYVNLPNLSYNTSAQAQSDPDKSADFNIPVDFRGTGFLIARLVITNSGGSGGTFALVDNEDLRGQFPSTFAGGTASTTTVFSDTAFRIHDDADTSKDMAFEVSAITTATTRTWTVPDQNLDFTPGTGDFATAAEGDLAATALQNIVEDVSPQLGAALDVNSFAIVSASAGDIAITPDTTGDVILDGTKWPQDVGTNLYFLQTDGAGQASWVAATGTGDVVGPASAGDNAICRFDSTTGKLIQNSGILIDDSDNMSNLGSLTMSDDTLVLFGTGGPARFMFDTGGTNDHFVLGVDVGATGGSGYFSVMERNDIANANRQPASTTPDPTLRVYSADAAAADDYIEFFHNQTNPVIQMGGTGSVSLLIGATGLPIQSFTNVASSVSYVNVTNATTGVGPTIQSTGETNLDLLLVAAGTGVVKADGAQVLTAAGTGLTATANSVALDAEFFTHSKGIYIESPTATDDRVIYHTPVAITITRIYAETDAGTVTFTLEQRTEGSAFTTGTKVHNTGLVADATGEEQTTSFNDPTVPAGTYIAFVASAVSGATKVAGHFEYTVDDV